MPGYWRDEVASTATLRGGWLHTGDVGAIDGEGFLTLKDRSKDLIISGGSNIYPREVEEVLLRHAPTCSGSLGDRPRPHPSGARKSWPAWWRVRNGLWPRRISMPDCALTPSRASSRQRDYVFLRKTLPKNNYGKVLKTELRKSHGSRNMREPAASE